MALALDKENDSRYSDLNSSLSEPELTREVESSLDLERMLAGVAGEWDGGYVMCGATGAGSMFAVRDPNGIRPAFFYIDDEIVVLASERPVIQTVFDVPSEKVEELQPGTALIIGHDASVKISRILPQYANRRCSFERIYFSRGSDKDIYRERKALGANLAPHLLDMLHNDVEHAVFSFIPNTAEVAFYGMVQGLEQRLDQQKLEELRKIIDSGIVSDDKMRRILAKKIRIEKVAIKDVKMRTFIAEGTSRNDMVAHVYDVTYGSVRPGVDTLVAIDDSIVRGTTLARSILRQLDRLNPKRIIIVSSSPQVRYPDYYGIDMSELSQFIAFHAAIHLLRTHSMDHIIHETYSRCLAQRRLPDTSRVNCVKAIYKPFTEQEISDEICRLLVDSSPSRPKAEIDILYQTLDGLHRAVPSSPGDWYFSGDYPTPGGIKLVNEAFIDWYEKYNDNCVIK